MRAIQVQEFGGPEVLVLREVADPVAGPGQVVVRLAAADVIFLDTLLRGGWGGEIFPLELPYVPGTGGAGTVTSVGDGVDPAWVGRDVVAHGPGYAELLASDLDDVVPVPQGVGLAEAAALMTDGVTALRLVRHAPAAGGRAPWVLVAAAAGGAGSLLVQLLHDAGLRVIGAARGERKLDLARELGAEVVVDYTQAGWVERVRVLDLATQGRIRPAVGATYALADASAAHVALAERTTVGKSLLLI